MSGQLRLSGGRRLKSPPGRGTRPTTARVREAVMNMLGSRLEGCRWLDLCSGSGIMGCEALLHGAAALLHGVLHAARLLTVAALGRFDRITGGQGRAAGDQRHQAGGQ